MKHHEWHGSEFHASVAPPRGERGLKPVKKDRKAAEKCRSPSWGAWIETATANLSTISFSVAPPRGERGLKLNYFIAAPDSTSRSPSWGAWIETTLRTVIYSGIAPVAPPRGERGLKQVRLAPGLYFALSLPLVGSVD